MVTNNRTYTNTKTCPKCKQTRVYFLVYDHRIYVPAHRPHSSGSGSSSSRHFTLNIRLTRHFKYATASRRTSSTVYRQLLIGFVYVSTTVSCRRPVVPFTRTHRNAECSRWTANYGNSKSNANTNNGRKKELAPTPSVSERNIYAIQIYRLDFNFCLLDLSTARTKGWCRIHLEIYWSWLRRKICQLES